VSPVFERFSEEARQVVVFANDEARALGHGFIGLEHLLLALLRDLETPASEALEALGVRYKEVKADVKRTVPRWAEVPDQIPFTPAAKDALQQGLSEALRLGHNYLGPEHILLGLLGPSAKTLERLGASAEAVRAEVLELTRPGRSDPTGDVACVNTQARWAYRVLAVDELSANELTEWAAGGWHLVAISGEVGEFRVVFKRPD
jgi:ATP-dependent Clp protease ATP-binding subunit ClpC